MAVPDHQDIVPAGDAALLVTLGDEIDLELNARVRGLAKTIEDLAVPGVTEIVIAYATLLVHFDPTLTGFGEVRDAVLRASSSSVSADSLPSRTREIPTVYGGAYGIDLPAVAARLGMSEEEVVRTHTEATYTVFMLGFSPGNPYLGGISPRLALPRLETPRPVVPAGTVAIANQTNVYAITSPGGWHWLGRTPIPMFDPSADPVTFLQAGDRVRFVPISEERYLGLGGEKAEMPS